MCHISLQWLRDALGQLPTEGNGKMREDIISTMVNVAVLNTLAPLPLGAAHRGAGRREGVWVWRGDIGYWRCNRLWLGIVILSVGALALWGARREPQL